MVLLKANSNRDRPRGAYLGLSLSSNSIPVGATNSSAEPGSVTVPTETSALSGAAVAKARSTDFDVPVDDVLYVQSRDLEGHLCIERFVAFEPARVNGVPDGFLNLTLRRDADFLEKLPDRHIEAIFVQGMFSNQSGLRSCGSQLFVRYKKPAVVAADGPRGCDESHVLRAALEVPTWGPTLAEWLSEVS